jgi:serine O-acetyltransferase
MTGLKALQEGELPLLKQLREDYVAHSRRTSPGWRAIAVHRYGVWRMRLEPKELRMPFSLLYRLLERRIIRTYGIELPYSVKLGRRTVIHHQGGIVVNGYCVIGDDCIIRHSVTLGNRYHHRPTEAPKIGNRVNIGVGAVVLGCVVVGDGANIGANALVLDDVPPCGTAVGQVARILSPKPQT